MGFTFQERSGLDICGKRYEVDLADVGFIEAIMIDFAGIMRECEALEKLHQEVSDPVLSEEKIIALGQKLTESNRRVFDSGIRFIGNVLGEKERDEIFFGRRANSADVVELCAYLYRTALQSREEVVNSYVLPNRDQRRTATRKSGGKRKKSED